MRFAAKWLVTLRMLLWSFGAQAVLTIEITRGVEIRTGVAFERILEAGGRAAGLALSHGTEVAAGGVAANANPRVVAKLAGGDAWPEAFASYQCESATFRMNVALSELPDFTCLPGRAAAPHHASGIVLAPTLAYMDRAHATAREEGWSREPIVEVLIPSTVDDTLAPRGAHVASLFCQHFRYALPGGRRWEDERERAAGGTVRRPVRQRRPCGLRPGGDPVHGGHHRPQQGGDAVARQPVVERAGAT